MPKTFDTPMTKLLGIKHPIILAGMNHAAGPELAAAVTNAGGIGVIGGVGYTPKFLKIQIDMLKKELNDKNAPFGVDLLLPKVGEGARATNYDYTDGKLPQLIDIIIQEGAKLFVSAVGVPPRWAVEKLHKAGILVMNMVGAPKHVKYALQSGCDIICVQGGEGGGHTGDVPTSVLVPKCADLIKGRTSELHGGPIDLVAGGGVFDGRGLAMMLSLGASAVWVGTRFVASEESGAPKSHKEAVLKCGYSDTLRTLIYTGRPLRLYPSPLVKEWEETSQDVIKQSCKDGVVPVHALMAKKVSDGEVTTQEAQREKGRMWLMGSAAGAITEILPAKTIMETMIAEAVEVFETNSARIVSKL